MREVAKDWAGVKGGGAFERDVSLGMNQPLVEARVQGTMACKPGVHSTRKTLASGPGGDADAGAEREGGNAVRERLCPPTKRPLPGRLAIFHSSCFRW